MTVSAAHRSVDFRMLPVFLLQLLQSFLLLLPLLLIQALQVLPPLVLLQHLVALELLVPLRVVVLQVLSGLDEETKRERSDVRKVKRRTREVTAAASYGGDEQLQVFGLKGVLVVWVQVFKLLQQRGVIHLQT